MADSVIVPFLKLQPSPNDALLKGDRSIFNQVRRNLLDLFFLLTGVFESILEVAWFGEVRVDGLRWLDKQVVKFRSAPLILRSDHTSDS